MLRGPGTRLGYFAQQVPDPQATVGEFLRAGLADVFAAEHRMRELESMLAGGRDVLAEYAEVQERWTALRGWTAAPRLAEIRARLDIAHLPDDAGSATSAAASRPGSCSAGCCWPSPTC